MRFISVCNRCLNCQNQRPLIRDTLIVPSGTVPATAPHSGHCRPNCPFWDGPGHCGTFSNSRKERQVYVTSLDQRKECVLHGLGGRYRTQHVLMDVNFFKPAMQCQDYHGPYGTGCATEYLSTRILAVTRKISDTSLITNRGWRITDQSP